MKKAILLMSSLLGGVLVAVANVAVEGPQLSVPLAIEEVTLPQNPLSTTVGPGLNRKARRISRRSRRRTLFKTRGSAAKTRSAVKRRGRGYDRAARKGFNQADKAKATKKKKGCRTN